MAANKTDAAAKGPVIYAERVVAILSALADGPDLWSVTGLAQALSIPASSVHRTLDHLVTLEYVERAPRRRYRIGSEFFRVAARVESRFELVGIAKPIMQSIVAECEETCLLGVLAPSRKRLLVAHKIESAQALRFRFGILDNIPLAWGAIGRVILAHLSATDLRAALAEAPVSPVNAAPAPELSDLTMELEAVRRHGFAMSAGQRVAPDAVEVAAPFFGAGGQVRGSLGVIMPDLRANDALQGSLAQLLRIKANHLSRQLGFGGRT